MLWISHRGYHVECIENSLLSFDRAIEQGFTALETDLRSTQDGHIVLQHDSSLARTCGVDTKLEDLRLAEIRQLRTKDNQPLVLFDDFIQRYAGCSWIFDIKPESSQRTLHLLKNWAQKKQAVDWISDQARFLLWNRKDEVLAKQLFPSVNTLARQDECYQAGLSVLLGLGALGRIQSGRTYSLPRYFMRKDLFTSSFVEAYHKRGAKLIAYLPECEQDSKAAAEAGFDEILTNGLPLKSS